jgi:hypothetical protein
MYVDNNPVGMAFLTGVVAADPVKTRADDYVLNAQLSTMVRSGMPSQKMQRIDWIVCHMWSCVKKPCQQLAY